MSLNLIERTFRAPFCICTLIYIYVCMLLRYVGVCECYMKTRKAKRNEKKQQAIPVSFSWNDLKASILFVRCFFSSHVSYLFSFFTPAYIYLLLFFLFWLFLQTIRVYVSHTYKSCHFSAAFKYETNTHNTGAEPGLK